MTRLWPDGSAITVAFDRLGHPTSFVWQGRRHTITTIRQTWSINADWWSTEGEVAREYFAVTTNDNLLCVLYYDSHQQAAYAQRGLVSIDAVSTMSVDDWLDVLVDIMALLPPRRIVQYVTEDTDVEALSRISSRKRVTVLTELAERINAQRQVDSVPWRMPPDWKTLWQKIKELVLLFMQGATYVQIAQEFLKLPAGTMTNSRTTGAKPIPAVLKFQHDVIDRLAIDAGCFLAIHEFAVHGEGGTICPLPEALQALPLCIRYGCDSLGVLAWYRFGFRQRSCAHALQNAFPAPPTLNNDTQRANWVREARRNWLARQLANETPLLAAARAVIETGSVL